MRHRASIPQDMLSWESQVCQYLDAEPPAKEGITYHPGPTDQGVVDCLLYWRRLGSGMLRIVGILNHYPIDMPPWERAGNISLWVRKPEQRQGIGTALWDEAVRRWGVDLERQSFTPSGARLADYLSSRDQGQQVDAEQGQGSAKQ